MKPFLALIFVLACGYTSAQNQPPQISNLETTLSGNEITVTYDLLDNENDLVQISFRAGEAKGISLDLETTSATGDVGSNITSGIGKTIVWDWSAHADIGPNFRIMLVADDLQPVDIQDIVDQVDSLQVKNYLSQIEGTRHRTLHLQHLRDVQNLMISSFNDHGLDTRIQTFNFGPYEAKNIIGRMIGTEDETAFFIIDGHYDSVSNSPGADDNGSAVAGVLEALRVLSNYSFRKSIKFIGFDLEEAGLVGSMDYVQNGLDAIENIAGVLNFEMIGYYSDVPNSQTLPPNFDLLFPAAVQYLEANEYRGDFINIVADGPSTFLSAAYKNAIDNYVPTLKYLVLDIPVPPSNVPDLLRSDHASFWLNSKPAIMLTDGANFRNPNYHTPGDSLGTLDFTFMSRVIKAAVGTIAELAEVSHSTNIWADTDFASAIKKIDLCNFEISPNPATDVISIQFEKCDFVKAQLRILNLNGITMFENSIKHHLTERSIDVSDWQRGVYFISVQSGKDEWVQKIILN